jgi:hypothetical protein
LHFYASSPKNIKMFVPTILDLSSDGLAGDALTFVTFRRSLKSKLRSQYKSVFGEESGDMTTKKLMLVLKPHMSFPGVEIKRQRRNLDAASAGILLAEIVFSMFGMLCAINHEFHTSSKIKAISGVVNESPRGQGPTEKLIFAMDLIDGISCLHPAMKVIVSREIDTLDNFFAKNCRMMIVSDA